MYAGFSAEVPSLTTGLREESGPLATLSAPRLAPHPLNGRTQRQRRTTSIRTLFLPDPIRGRGAIGPVRHHPVDRK
jgi:hypothetical protein